MYLVPCVVSCELRVRVRVRVRVSMPQVWEEEFVLDGTRGTNMALIHTLVFEVRDRGAPMCGESVCCYPCGVVLMR